MNEEPERQPDTDENDAMRAVIRGDMLRANTAVAIVLGALLVLALAAGVAGLRATRNLHRAEQAEAMGRERLATAYLAQARAIRVAGEPGRSEAALGAISNAAAISQSGDLRTEAIASLALTDLKEEEDGELLAVPPATIYITTDRELKHFITADERGTVTVSSIRDGKSFHLDTGHAVLGFAASPDGHWLAVNEAGGGASVWDLQTKHKLEGPPLAAGDELSFSADSQALIYSDASASNLISVCALPGFQITRSAVPARNGQFFKASGDRRKVAVCQGMNVYVRDLATGTNLLALLHESLAMLLTWSADGKKLAVSCSDGDVYLWDLATGGHKVLTGPTARGISMGFSADGLTLFTGSQDETTRLWDTTLGKTIATGNGIAYGMTPDGKHIGYWRVGIQTSGFGIWDVSPSPYYSILSCDVSAGPLNTLDLSTSGRWCAATQEKGFRIWDLRNGNEEFYVPVPGISCARFSPDDKSVLICLQTALEMWPLNTNSTGELDLRPESAKQIRLPDDVGARAIAVAMDGRTAAVELSDLRMAVIDLAGQRSPVFLTDSSRDRALRGPGSVTGAGRFAISPDGKWLATGFSFGKDNAPKVYDTATGQLAATLNANNALVAFSPDGRWLGLAGMHGFSFWSVGDWRQHFSVDRDAHTVILGALAFGPDHGAAMGRTRQILRIGDFASNSVTADLISPIPQSINSARMALDGSVLVTATAGDMVEVWRLDQLRGKLAELGLAGTPGPTITAVQPGTGRHVALMIVAALAAFAVASAFALFTLQRHRMAIERFVVAEASAAQRNRELDAAKTELMHSQKMQALGTLATGIAHDFNNLLSVIRMSNKLVGRRTAGDTEIQEHVADIEQAVLQGKGVVSSMLGYARERDSGEPVDVGSVVEEVVSLLSKEFLRGITLDLEMARSVPTVNAGRGALEQILLNLVINAAEAMQGDGRLKIIVRVVEAPPKRDYVVPPGGRGPLVELTVNDSGPGIATEFRSRVFEPFFTTKRGSSKPGTGLGLSLVYSLAQQSRAALCVDSGQGRGATFTLYFPVNAPDPVRQTHSTQILNPA